jgi:hypothetical protein
MRRKRSLQRAPMPSFALVDVGKRRTARKLPNDRDALRLKPCGLGKLGLKLRNEDLGAGRNSSMPALPVNQASRS